jgi:cyanate lyase
VHHDANQRAVVSGFGLRFTRPGRQSQRGTVLDLDHDAVPEQPDPGNVTFVGCPSLDAPVDPVIHRLGEVVSNLTLEAGAGRFR